MKANQIAPSKSVQHRHIEQAAGSRLPKQPKVPVFLPEVVGLVNKLNNIIDIDVDPARRAWAYGLLTRLCVFWCGASTGEWTFTTEPKFAADMIGLIAKLFPDADGLPVPLGGF